MPAIGMGTFGSDAYGPDQVAAAVADGLRLGYRLIDCAAVYGNEAEVGQVLGGRAALGVCRARSCSWCRRCGTTPTHPTTSPGRSGAA